MSIRATELVHRRSSIVNGGWLPDMDLNHDKQIQSLLCYRYTIGQRRFPKIGISPGESRQARRAKPDHWINGLVDFCLRIAWGARGLPLIQQSMNPLIQSS